MVGGESTSLEIGQQGYKYRKSLKLASILGKMLGR